jgi:hypothetical protein
LTDETNFSKITEMKHKISLTLISLSLVCCATNPNKPQDVQTQLEKPSTVSGSQKVGLKNGEMVVLDKAQIAERLRDLQNQVYSLEDKVYGTRKLGSLGLYGELKSCKRKLASKQYGGPGTMTWTEPLDRVTDKEEELKIGQDENKDLVGVNEEYLKDRLQRFQGYKMILQKRADEFEEKIEACNADVMAKRIDSAQSSKVMVTEAPKAMSDKNGINDFMCGYVRPGASLENFMINAFAHGWLSLSDFQLTQTLLSNPLKDSKGNSMDHAFLFQGWKMAFDNGPIAVGDLLRAGSDAKMVAWAYDHKSEVSSGAACLPAPDGVWNH